jgi:hypothetical protein
MDLRPAMVAEESTIHILQLSHLVLIIKTRSYKAQWTELYSTHSKHCIFIFTTVGECWVLTRTFHQEKVLHVDMGFFHVRHVEHACSTLNMGF